MAEAARWFFLVAGHRRCLSLFGPVAFGLALDHGDSGRPQHRKQRRERRNLRPVDAAVITTDEVLAHDEGDADLGPHAQ